MGLRATRQIAARFAIFAFAGCEGDGVDGRVAGQDYQIGIVDAVRRTAADSKMRANHRSFVPSWWTGPSLDLDASNGFGDTSVALGDLT
jgi:hypothetical protein